MWEFTLFFCVLILSLVGLTELLHKLWLRILKPKTMPRRLLVVFLKDDNAQQQLNYTQEFLRWSGEQCATELIAIDCGVKGALYKNCNGDCKNCNLTKIYSYNEIIDVLKREQICNGTVLTE